MSASNSLEAGLLDLLFFGTTFANIAINATAGPLTSLYISLHTADPGEAGDQTTSETSYTGYARVAVTRDAAGWTRTNNSVTNDATITFGQNTNGTPTITHVGLGSSSSGAGVLYLSNALDSALVMQVGATPLFSATELEFTCD